jgi:hypothetical protein
MTLQEVVPVIWRRLLVPADIALPRLHALLNDAKGWQDSHLHSFRLRDRTFGDPRTDDSGDLEFETNAASGSASSRRRPGTGVRLRLGDGWTHDLLVEKVLEVDKRHGYALCIGGAWACPAEDCGGPPATRKKLVAALPDPKHDYHDEMADRGRRSLRPRGTRRQMGGRWR